MIYINGTIVLAMLAAVTFMVWLEYKRMARKGGLPCCFTFVSNMKQTWRTRRVVAARRRWLTERADVDLQASPSTTAGTCAQQS